jgi:hypothetical protein
MARQAGNPTWGDVNLPLGDYLGQLDRHGFTAHRPSNLLATVSIPMIVPVVVFTVLPSR